MSLNSNLLTQEALLSQRGRAMLRICQLASTLQCLKRNLLSLVTAASDLPLSISVVLCHMAGFHLH